jgi:hypothetical protein
MIVDATNIEELKECYPSWQVPYKAVELDREELLENKTFTLKKEDEILNSVSKEVLDVLDDLCLKEDLGINASRNYKKLLAIYSLIDYLNILKGELVYCTTEGETYSELIKRKKEEFKLDCIRKAFACEYDIADIYEDIYDSIGIPSEGATAPGLGQMTINNDNCNIYTIYKTK